MRKLIGRVAALALILLAVILLHEHVRPQAAPEEMPDEPQQADAVTVTQAREQLTLGAMQENTDLGGVDITVTGEDGTKAVYTFTDVEKNSWYADAVNFAVSNGLMNGVSDQPIFQPEYGITRESFAVILYRLANGSPSELRDYEDVPDDAWYREAVCWATANGCIPALTVNRFGVGEFVTCEQALSMLYRLAGAPETDATLATYPYAPKVTASMYDAVAWAWESGLITEIECVWYPTQAISRAQVALLLMRYRAMI